MTLVELAFPAMGTHVRLLGSPGAPLNEARAAIEDLEARLTRFDSQSELCRLNADPRPVVPASAVLRAAVAAALAGAAATHGLADPTLLGAVVRAGYARSLTGHPRAELRAALAAAPSPAPGRPAAAADWRRVRVDDRARTIARPPGVRLDLGGSAKGLAADRAAALLAPHGPCAADLGGDVRVHGTHDVLVAHPLTGHSARLLELTDAAVATSGIDRRIWWDGLGRPAHHLLDPATGRPAWTGVLTATARAPSAALAEALAKAAVLAGPERGRALLAAAHGGVLVTTAGDVLDAGGPRRGAPPVDARAADGRRPAAASDWRPWLRLRRSRRAIA
jgi:FAD:protein FMN transferase